MKDRFDPRFPHQHGWPRVAVVASVLLHVLLFLSPVESRPPTIQLPPERVIVLPQSPSDQNSEPALTYVPPRTQPRARRPEQGTDRGRGPVTTRGPEAALVPFVPLEPRLERPPVDSGRGDAARGFARVAPDYGNGVLWVRPVPVSPEVIARRLKEEHFEQVDSAVTVIMQAFLDSLAAEPGSAQRLPEWTTNVAGSKFGLDSRFIYIAGLKIPAAVLALLPLPQGNIDQARAYNHLMDLRADIERAARRADNMDEFKRVIREIRERKQRERDFERAQREAPPPAPPPQQDPPTP